MLEKIFPTASEIPSIGEPIEQREYLINGELRTWKGNLSPVLSPVFIRNGDKHEQKILGYTPLLNSDEAMLALDAAVKAYDLGKGTWPTMSVADRITHVEKFLVI